MPSCAIKWCGKCTTTSSYTKDGITFHRFPNDGAMREIWLNATHRDNFFPTKYSVICSRHFTPDCFENLKNNRRRLYNSSVPTLYLPSLIPSADFKNTRDEPSSTKDIKTESSKSTITYADLKTTQDQPSSSKDVQTVSSKRTSSCGQNYKGIEEQCVDLTPRKRKMQRQIDHLIFSLNKKKKHVKRLQDKIRALKKKVASLQKNLDTLTKIR